MTLSQCFSVFTILGALTLSAPARADVPPEDACSASNVGEACSNAKAPMAQGTGTGAGLCQAAMCTRPTPDGSMTYPCYRCLPSDDGGGGQANEAGGAGAGAANNTSGSAAGGTPSSGAAGASAGGTAKAGSSSSAGAAAKGSASAKSGSDNGGCTLSPTRSGGGALWAGLIALGVTVAGIRRSRSLKS